MERLNLTHLAKRHLMISPVVKSKDCFGEGAADKGRILLLDEPSGLDP